MPSWHLTLTSFSLIRSLLGHIKTDDDRAAGTSILKQALAHVIAEAAKQGYHYAQVRGGESRYNLIDALTIGAVCDRNVKTPAKQANAKPPRLPTTMERSKTRDPQLHALIIQRGLHTRTKGEQLSEDECRCVCTRTLLNDPLIQHYTTLHEHVDPLFL